MQVRLTTHSGCWRPDAGLISDLAPRTVRQKLVKGAEPS
jgi:hypothetical protein